MHFLIFTVLASLVICSHAAAILPRQGITNPRLAQFRVFSETGCFRLNQGFYTIDLDQANQCYDLSADSATASPNGYVSIELQAVTVNATALNCHFLLYPDNACTQTPTDALLDVCEDASVFQDGAVYPTWNSYYYKCDTVEPTTYPTV